MFPSAGAVFFLGLRALHPVKSAFTIARCSVFLKGRILWLLSNRASHAGGGECG
jgi:hypothetical protein